MLDEFRVKVRLFWQRDLDHDQMTRRKFVNFFEQARFQQRFGFGFLRAMDIHFRLDNRHETRGKDLRSDLELLIDNGFDTGGIGLVVNGEHLFVPKMRLVFALASSAASPGIGFIKWTPSFSSVRPLSTFRNGTTRFTF